MRSDQEIIHQTNILALLFSKRFGWEVPLNYLFYKSQHPRAILYWTMACDAQSELTNTDVSNILSEMEGCP